MALVALLSNPNSTGNKALLPKVRCYCAQNSEIFHYEVEDIGQVARAMEMIARVRPKVLVINGGDGTVQTALTELYHGGHFQDTPPPVAVLPNGKTNLIALDLGAQGDPLVALGHIVEIARGDVNTHIVTRELIALSGGGHDQRPVLGMFLGGAGLADIMLYCRHKIYPMGLPNGISHLLTAFAAIFAVLFGFRAKFLPQRANPVRISMLRDGELIGSYSVLIVTTLEKLLLGGSAGAKQDGMRGRLKFMAVDQRMGAIIKLIASALFGQLGKYKTNGIHFRDGDTIRIDGGRSSVILDGEVFEADNDHPIILTSTPPVPFLRLAV